MPAARALGYTEQDLVARIARYSTLRAAERVLEPYLRTRFSLPTARIGGRLLDQQRGILAAIRSQRQFGGPRSELPAGLSRIDSELGQFAVRLRSKIASTPIARLRVTLAPIARLRPEVVRNLLDFCLEDEELDKSLIHLSDYLITLLASQDGKTLTCDPTSVSSGVARRCDYFRGRPNETSRRAVARFDAAAAELATLDDLAPLVSRMRLLKLALDRHIFVPELLRSVVSYNLAVANRLSELMAGQRDDAAEPLDALRALDEDH